MKLSAVSSKPEGQLTLNFEQGLSERYPSLRECVASSVYRYGLTNAAIDLDKAPGNLSVELSADPSRKFSVDSLEQYITKSGDLTPVYYLVDKFLRDEKAEDANAAELLAIMKQLAPHMKRAGVL